MSVKVCQLLVRQPGVTAAGEACFLDSFEQDTIIEPESLVILFVCHRILA